MFVSSSHAQSPNKSLEKAKRICIVNCILAKMFGNLLRLVMLSQSFPNFGHFEFAHIQKWFEFCVHFYGGGMTHAICFPSNQFPNFGDKS